MDNNETLLLFDNGDSATRQQSRGLEFKLDERRKTVRGFKAYNIPEPFSQYMGSVDKIGDDYFIAGGSGNYLLEVNSVTGAKKFELKDSLALYRAYMVQDISGIKR